ncbi:MAG: DUF2141 domain-containing protein [Flavobacteriales bacterium]
MKKDKNTHDLTVCVQSIQNSKGLVEFALYKNPALFTQTGKTHRLARVDAKAPEVKFQFTDLEATNYAVVVYHDDNSNKICDKNMFGIPTEAYAFSNNKRPKLSAPSFEECAVKLDKDKVITIKMVY